MPSPTLTVLDMNPALRRQLVDFFTQRGFDIEAHGTLALARDAASRAAPDVVVVDELLVDHDTLQWVSRLCGGPEPPATILTAVHEEPTAAHRGWSWTHVLNKPFSPQELFSTALRVMGQGGVSAPNPASTQPLPAVNTEGGRPTSGSRMRMQVGESAVMQPTQRLSNGPPPDASSGDIARRLDSVRKVYGKRLPGLLTTLEDSIAEARRESAPGALDHARRIALQIRGTAGSFGFEATARAVGELEASLREPAPGEAYWDTLDAQVSASQQALSKDTSDAPASAAAQAEAPSHSLTVVAVGLSDAAHVAARRACAAIGVELQSSGAVDPAAVQIMPAAAAPLSTGRGPLLILGEPEGRGRWIQRRGVRVLPEEPSARQVLEGLIYAADAARPPLALLLSAPTSTPLSQAVEAMGGHVHALEDDLPAALGSRPWDLTFVDGGRDDAPALIKRLRASPHHGWLPVLATLPQGAPEALGHALTRAGASRLLPHGAPDEQVQAAVAQATEVARATRGRLRPAAAPIPAAAFLSRADEALSRARRFGAPLALALLRLEGAADLPLAGGRLAAALRGDDLLGAWVGADVALLLQGGGAAHLDLVLERLGQSVEASVIHAAAHFPADGTHLVELLSAAAARLGR